MEGEEFEESPVRSHALENSEMEGEEFEESIVRSHALESSEDQDLESTLVGQFEGEALSVAKDLRDRWENVPWNVVRLVTRLSCLADVLVVLF